MLNHYIPSIDELYIGFECKIKHGNEYIPYTINNHNDFNVHFSEFRVKWLDKQDIIDLGFTLKKDFEGYSKFYINVPNAEPLYYTLECENTGPNTYVSIIDNYGNRLVDRLWLRNKNELKWVLNRYGILTKDSKSDS